MTTTLREIEDRARDVLAYIGLRAEHPEIPALKLWGYVKSDGSESLAEYLCPGHEWSYTGTAYGGDDESYYGEGRCYCRLCGKDGDA